MTKEPVFVNDSAISPPGHSQPGKSTGLVPFLFAVAGLDELPGTVLKRLLGDLGMTPSGAHALIARLRSEGLLAARRNGRGADYRLAGSLAAGYERVRAGRSAESTTWTGTFHALLYQVPETQRGFRDMLRRAAQVNGYGPLQPGVLIALTDRSAGFAHIVAKAPERATVRSAWLRMDEEPARDAAYAAWGLAELERRYRAHTRKLRAAIRGRRTEPPADAATLCRYTELVSQPLIDTLGDPNLPSELLPERWPRADLQTEIDAVNRRYWPAASRYVRGMLAPG